MKYKRSTLTLSIMQNALTQLDSYRHSSSTSNNKSGVSIKKIWIYYQNSKMMKLTYFHKSMNILSINKCSGIREDTNMVYHNMYYENIEDKYQQEIVDMNTWLNDNLQFIIDSNKTADKMNQVIQLITQELGEYNFASMYDVGWSIPSIFKLTVEIYTGNIILNYKNKDTKLTDKKIKLFLQKNKDNILNAKQKEHQKYLNKLEATREEERIRKLEEKTVMLKIIEDDTHDSTKRVGFKSHSTSLFIKKSLKQRYESQACKPFPEKYPWH